ncbi:MAG: tetratricopeptide repeat protein [Armatimonadetes bacterium]|nr:tetratricopeptide repeat protein [Armatimonadota bacterium]
MSIMRMRKFFRKPLRLRFGRKHLSFGTPVQVVFWGIVIIFVVGAYYSFGPAGRARSAQSEQGGRRVSAVVAVVGGKEIPREQFERELLRTGYDESPVSSRPMTKLSALEQLIDSILELEAAKHEGIKVSGKEVEQKREEMLEQAIQARFPTKRDLKEYLDRKRMTYEQLKQKIRDEQLGDLDAIRKMLLVDKLRELVESRVQVTDAELRASFEEIKARHILIRPSEEKKRIEADYKKRNQQPPADLDADALARKRAEDLLAQIKKGADFAKLAREFSDDKGSAKQGGDLGWFRPGTMVPEFEQAAFALKPGQVSEVVKTDFGYHIIQVTERRSKLPADFEKNKEKYRAEELQKRKGAAWPAYLKELRKQTQITIVDAELRGYKNLSEGKQDEAMADLEEAVRQDPQNVDAAYQLAMLYRDKGDKNRAVELLQQVAGTEQGARMADVRMALGDLLMDLKRKDEALTEYRAASEWAVRPDFSSYFIHLRLKDKFKELGQKELAAQEQAWLNDFAKRQQEMPGGMGMPITIPPGG